MTTDLCDELKWRGLLHQCSNLEKLTEKLAAGPLTLYCGFDPTAQSLHVGSLIPLLALSRFQKAGHRALALVGGATGLIGDPSGKAAERNLQSNEEVAVRTGFISAQLAKFVDVTDSAKGAVVNNLSWTEGVGVLEFLREVGKHFSVNAMIQRDSVRSRIDREGEGISFTEFSYMLLQAFDFLKLHELENCSLQIGGSDQWGNMCSGADLIRRKHGEQAFALTLPLLTTSEGEKFGKTAKGAIWLDANLTSPWDFYQFWLNTADADVVSWLKLFTFRPREEIEQLARDTQESPGLRKAQRILAEDVTVLVHGADVFGHLTQAAAILFDKKTSFEALTLESLVAMSKATLLVPVPRDSVPQLNALLVQAGLEASTTKANQTIRLSPAVSVNAKIQTAIDFLPAEEDWLHGRFLLLKKGKKNFAFIERVG